MGDYPRWPRRYSHPVKPLHTRLRRSPRSDGVGIGFTAALSPERNDSTTIHFVTSVYKRLKMARWGGGGGGGTFFSVLTILFLNGKMPAELRVNGSNSGFEKTIARATSMRPLHTEGRCTGCVTAKALSKHYPQHVAQHRNVLLLSHVSTLPYTFQRRRWGEGRGALISCDEMQVEVTQ